MYSNFNFLFVLDTFFPTYSASMLRLTKRKCFMLFYMGQTIIVLSGTNGGIEFLKDNPKIVSDFLYSKRGIINYSYIIMTWH